MIKLNQQIRIEKWNNKLNSKLSKKLIKIMEFFVYKFQTYYECYNLFLPLKFREIIIIMYFVQFHEF